MKLFRYALWGVVFILGAFLAYMAMSSLTENKSNSPRADVGGPFTAVLVRNGEPAKEITEAALKGRPHIMFFGFTHCPDVCPTTLYEAGQWYDALGADADKVDIYFVTVDPARDTAKTMAQYLSAFNPRIKAITGGEEQIAEMISEYRIFAEKVATDDGYTMNHTATTYLMDAKGDFVRTIAYGESKDTAVAKIKKLIAEDGK